ncbi:MAG TPA: Nif3-like dinuclear metal center hexameric protein [Gammaproteobacteria bacterium]
MVNRDELVVYCDKFLESGAYQDYAPNGLQVAGRERIATLVSGVTACAALIEAAIELKADALLVHHGWFWRGEEPRVVGMKARRLRQLLCADINLIAYHLPLDGHATLGNNVVLGERLGVALHGRFGEGPAGGIACHGVLEPALSAEALGRRMEQLLARRPLLLHGGSHPIRRLGWCSGAAQGYLEQAAALGLDAFVSGEVSERTFHEARELGIHYFAAGHHATERYGVAALGEHLARKYGLTHRFIDIDNPV